MYLNENEILTNEIISSVRCAILNQMKNMPGMDPWNEHEGGAGWLDNEISMAIDLLAKIKDFDPINWSIYHSVDEIKCRLMMLSIDDLRFIKHVIVVNGGTQHDFHFNLQKEPAHVIRAYFNL